jgi:hypothetical protein
MPSRRPPSRAVPPELFANVARQGGGHPSVTAAVMVLQALEA